jgi:tRNA nucleotidyltransferase (CCA-adding enzyme)
MKTYLVGGAIRDKILKIPVTERDFVVVGATSAALLKKGFKQVGRDFPVFLHPKTHEEYALARTERKTSKGYLGFTTDFNSSVTLEQDLKRRDLTINAIAEDKKGNIIDPYGGIKDLKNKVLRHICDSFCEDPLRILRLARFYAKLYHLGFKVAGETISLLYKMVDSGELSYLTPERIWNETKKALQEKNPQMFFYLLRRIDALVVLFPEINALFGKTQPAKYHPEVDSGVHTMSSLKAATKISDDPLMRFAVLCHDLGKGNTANNILPSHWGHEERGVKLITKLCDRIKTPKSYKDFAKKVAKFHTYCHKIKDLKPATILKIIEQMRIVGDKQGFKLFLLCCKADARGRLYHENDDYQQADIFAKILNAILQIDNNEIIKKTNAISNKQKYQAIKKERLKTITKIIK